MLVAYTGGYAVTVELSDGKQMSTPARGIGDKLLSYLWNMSIVCIPMLIAMAIYNGVGLYVCQHRPFVTGKVVSLHFDQGSHHVTNATVEFPAGVGSNRICTVRTWFRKGDPDMFQDYPIRVVSALSLCGTPWFPDHIPSPTEPLRITAFLTVLAVVLYFILPHRLTDFWASVFKRAIRARLARRQGA